MDFAIKQILVPAKWQLVVEGHLIREKIKNSKFKKQMGFHMYSKYMATF